MHGGLLTKLKTCIGKSPINIAKSYGFVALLEFSVVFFHKTAQCLCKDFQQLTKQIVHQPTSIVMEEVFFFSFVNDANIFESFDSRLSEEKNSF